MTQLAIDFAELEEDRLVLERSVPVVKHRWDHHTIEQTAVSKEFLEQIQETYSADKLLNDPPTLRGTFEHDGDRWFCCGVVYSNQGGYADCCRLVPADQWRGKPFSKTDARRKHGYHGMLVYCRGRFVIAAERRRFVPIKAPSLFGDSP